ncbi:hypothetical protein K461DRAFT_276235 [Myriangium duriaei CBS 260.36]|uniref:Nudix hydrolase domain-containing protein n=1 Tax=Myriangium duriaei CBS 260.36 TaxID=1168546 RepID=A0A9P4J429_9PEZI|nr:hypothetical protein K461DRAFT_276235 [Myriangium duriaei CBS 260.36]
MYRLKEMPPVRAMNFIHAPPQALKDAYPDPTDALCVRAAIFRTMNDDPYLLVLQRASTDSMPNRWELPGGMNGESRLLLVADRLIGGVDDQDDSIKNAVYREIKEETGLTAVWIVQEVGHGHRWQDVKGEKIIHNLYLTFVVESEEIELLERAGGEGSKTTTGLTYGEATRSAPTTATANVTTPNELDAVPVKLSDAEHQRYLWVSEDEIAMKCGGAGLQPLEFTSEETRQAMLQAFAVQREVIRARKTV